jgi:hypothetical protein
MQMEPRGQSSRWYKAAQGPGGQAAGPAEGLDVFPCIPAGIQGHQGLSAQAVRAVRAQRDGLKAQRPKGLFAEAIDQGRTAT